VEGRVELLPLDVVPRVVADTLATVLADAEADSYEVGELRSTAARLLATGLTGQQVAETLGVDAEQVRRWDDDAVTDAERDELVDGWWLP
ncbi:MAG: hypothetical protein ACRDV2_12115, partial [Actinomycetes bacterium]